MLSPAGYRLGGLARERYGVSISPVTFPTPDRLKEL